MRTVALLVLLLAACGCLDAPSHSDALIQSAPLAIRKEPVPDHAADSFSGCTGPPETPMLAILSKRTLLDGTPVDDSGLESTLNAKQELRALLGGEPIRDIVIQVGSKVPESRVARLLARAGNAGFVNVTRFPAILESSQPTRRSLPFNKPLQPSASRHRDLSRLTDPRP